MIGKAPRAAAIILHNKSILLMRRIKNSQEYYAFPGGTVEPGEKIEDAVLRELFEETSIKAEIIRLLYHLTIIDGASTKEEFFFLCDYTSGQPVLGPDSIEVERMRSGSELYEPLWINIDAIEQLRIYPPEVKRWVTDDLHAGFSTGVKDAVVRR